MLSSSLAPVMQLPLRLDDSDGSAEFLPAADIPWSATLFGRYLIVRPKLDKPR